MTNQNKLLFKKGGSSLLEDSSNNIPTPDDTWSYGLGRNAGVVDNMLSNQVIQEGSGKKPMSKKPMTKKPIDKKPMTKKPMTKKPMDKKPMDKKPMPKKPMDKKSMTKKSMGKKSVGKKTVSSEMDPMKSIQNLLQDLLKKVKSITK